MNEIVVGVDASPSALAALSWAAEQARATGQNLRAVHAVDVSPGFNMALGMVAPAVPMHPSATDAAYQETIEIRFHPARNGAGAWTSSRERQDQSSWPHLSARRCSRSAARSMWGSHDSFGVR